MRIFLENERAPSWNTYYSGKHWAKRKKMADEKHLLVRAHLDPNANPFEGPVAITLIATYKHHPVDSCNIMAKVYTDGLIGWVIEDDDMRYVTSTTCIPVLGDENSVEILIEEVPSVRMIPKDWDPDYEGYDPMEDEEYQAYLNS